MLGCWAEEQECIKTGENSISKTRKEIDPPPHWMTKYIGLVLLKTDIPNFIEK